MNNRNHVLEHFVRITKCLNHGKDLQFGMVLVRCDAIYRTLVRQLVHGHLLKLREIKFEAVQKRLPKYHSSEQRRQRQRTCGRADAIGTINTKLITLKIS